MKIQIAFLNDLQTGSNNYSCGKMESYFMFIVYILKDLSERSWQILALNYESLFIFSIVLLFIILKDEEHYYINPKCILPMFA